MRTRPRSEDPEAIASFHQGPYIAKIKTMFREINENLFCLEDIALEPSICTIDYPK